MARTLLAMQLWNAALPVFTDAPITLPLPMIADTIPLSGFGLE